MKTPHLLKWAGVALGALVLVAAATRLTAADAKLATNPGHTIQAQLPAPDGLAAVLIRSCGDCHSNTISSHWSSRVPPLSWIMARGAREGRKAVNFAEWAGYSPQQRRAILATSCDDARNATMPMGAYLRLHPDAKLSPRDVETICGAAR